MRAIVTAAAVLLATALSLPTQATAHKPSLVLGRDPSSDPATCGDDASVCTEWTLTKSPIALAGNPTPLYPLALHSKRLAGAVEVEFIIDSAGKVEVGSSHVTSSSDEQLSKTVPDIMPRLPKTGATWCCVAPRRSEPDGLLVGD
jgi:outer membrane biosynthesis protein TonB